jgi:hypothetical protein
LGEDAVIGSLLVSDLIIMARAYLLALSKRKG